MERVKLKKKAIIMYVHTHTYHSEYLGGKRTMAYH
jgi:hypothetical protein